MAFRNSLSRFSRLSRAFSTSTVGLTEGEKAVADKLIAQMKPAFVQVRDTSGGCGSMYAIEIEANQFAGKSVLQQHRMVREVLAEDIKKWHGIHLVTRVPQ